MSPRLDRTALFRAVGYVPHPGQRSVHESTATTRVLACGVRWGKSRVLALEALAATLAPADHARGWIVSPTAATTGIVVRELFALLRRHFAHRVVELDQRMQRAVVRNLGGGLTEVVGRSTDRPAALLGESLSWLLVDEAAGVRDDVWHEVLATRLIDQRGWSLVAGTPKGDRGWFYEAFETGQRGEQDTASWSAPTWANPHVPSEAIDVERARLEERTFYEQLGGEFIGAAGRRCRTCGPPPEFPQEVVVLLEDQELGACAECGRPLDQRGTPMGTRGDDGTWDIVKIRVRPFVPAPLRL